MAEIRWRSRIGTENAVVDEDHPFPIQWPGQPARLLGAEYSADMLWRMAVNKNMFVASDAVPSDAVTGQTSFDATTPTFLLAVPAGTTAVPLYVNLAQTGSVAGAFVDVYIAADFRVNRWSTGGTDEKVLSPRRNAAPTCHLYSGATASAASGAGAHRLWGASIGQDISPAEGAVQGPFWKPELPYLLEGPASLLVYTWAGTTGPTWLWGIGWAEFETGALG